MKYLIRLWKDHELKYEHHIEENILADEWAGILAYFFKYNCDTLKIEHLRVK